METAMETAPSGVPQNAVREKEKEINILRSEVASFMSSIGFATTEASSLLGFDDSDFRKVGPMKNHKPQFNKLRENVKSTSKHSHVGQNPRKNSKSGEVQDEKGKSRRDLNQSRGGIESKIGENARKEAGDENVAKKPPFSPADDYKNKYKGMKKLPLVSSSRLGVWYEDALELEKKLFEDVEEKMQMKLSLEEKRGVVEEKKMLGERLMCQYGEDYEKGRGSRVDMKMLVTTQRSGTATDKVSAFSVLVGDNPIANLRSLDAILGMITSKVGKRHALMGFEVLKELFTLSLLPDRKLKTLLQQPLNALPETKDGYSLLLLWYWEDCLKERYEHFVSALEEASADMLPILKDRAVKVIYTLLNKKPELEQRLLTLLVNKLGDPQSKVASNADFYLLSLLSEHPNMKMVVISEVDSFLFRPHLGLKPQYFAVNFLSQIQLGTLGNGPEVAKRLIEVYFALFKVLVVEARGNQELEQGSKKNTIKARDIKRRKMKTLMDSHSELDSRLLSALLTGVNRAFPFVSSGEVDDVVETQTPMLFKLVHSKNFNVGIQALMLLDKISSKNQIASDRFYRALYSKLLLPSALNSSKSEMFIALLLRAMKNDINVKRVTAFSKRILQVAIHQPPQYACGCLFLLSEVLKTRAPLWNKALQQESIDDDCEHFEDILEDSDKEDDAATPLKSESSKPLVHLSSSSSSFSDRYDPRHREPSFCNADRSGWWELTVLASHVHPSVAAMAETLLSGTNIVYHGNPLSDLSLGAFLDKLMEKKPKAATWHGGSQIEPARKLSMSHCLIGPEILSLAEVDVPPEDLVFHKFYSRKTKSSIPSKKKRNKMKSEEEEATQLFDMADIAEEEDDDDDDDDQELERENYVYDDLDEVLADDDEDLIRTSDVDLDYPPEANIGKKRTQKLGHDGDDNNDDDDDGQRVRKRKRNEKSSGKPVTSSFAPFEDYEHLLGESK